MFFLVRSAFDVVGSVDREGGRWQCQWGLFVSELALRSCTLTTIHYSAHDVNLPSLSGQSLAMTRHISTVSTCT
jgi:hypothetical protein